MYWRGFHASPIAHILDKEELTLEELLDEDEVIQETKSHNKKLISFMVQQDNLVKLIDFVVTSPPADADERRRYKYPYVASEILCCEIWSVTEAIVGNDALLLKLFAFLDQPPPLTPLLATYFSRVVNLLLTKRIEKMLAFFGTQPQIISQFVRHIGTFPIMELLCRMSVIEEMGELGLCAEWLLGTGFVSEVIDQFVSSDSADILTNTSQLLVDLIPSHAVKKSAFFAKLIDKATFEKLMQFSVSNPPDSLIYGIEILIQILDSMAVYNASTEGDTSRNSTAASEDESPKQERPQPAVPLDTQALLEEKDQDACPLPPGPNDSSLEPVAPVVQYEENDGPPSHAPPEPTVEKEEQEDYFPHSDSEYEATFANGENPPHYVLAIHKRVPDLVRILRDTESIPSLSLANGEIPRLTSARLKIIEFLLSTLRMNYTCFVDAFREHGLIQTLVDMFFLHQWNNFLHTVVTQIINVILETNCLTLQEVLFGECQIMDRILQEYGTLHLKQWRPGYIGHLTHIANNLIKASNFSSSVLSYLEEKPEWRVFAETSLADLNRIESLPLVSTSEASKQMNTTSDSDDEIDGGRSGGVALSDEFVSKFNREFEYRDDDQGHMRDRFNEDYNNAFDDDEIDEPIDMVIHDQHEAGLPGICPLVMDDITDISAPNADRNSSEDDDGDDDDTEEEVMDISFDDTDFDSNVTMGDADKAEEPEAPKEVVMEAEPAKIEEVADSEVAEAQSGVDMAVVEPTETLESVVQAADLAEQELASGDMAEETEKPAEPVVEESDALVVEETVPVAEEPSLAAMEEPSLAAMEEPSLAAMEEPAPAVEEPTPVVVEEPVAEVAPALAVEELARAVEEPAPETKEEATVEETPAVVEEQSAAVAVEEKVADQDPDPVEPVEVGEPVAEASEPKEEKAEEAGEMISEVVNVVGDVLQEVSQSSE